MDSARIVITALGAACLLVASLIVVVLRRPNPNGSRRSRVGEAEAQTLARLYVVHRTPSTPALDDLAAPGTPLSSGMPRTPTPANMPVSDPARLGRMPELPDLPGTPGTPGMPGVSAVPQHVDGRDRPLPAARIPVGPLPFERVSSPAGWDGGPDSLTGRPVSGELSLPIMPNDGAVLGNWPASSPGFPPEAQRGNNIGRMPGFAPASPSQPPSPIPPQRVADALEQRRLGAFTRDYAEGIQVVYDPVCDAVDVAFSACPMRTPAEVTLVSRVLLAKVRTILKPLGRDRAALLLDVGGLEIRMDTAALWAGSLKEFLRATCEQARPGLLLVARYNSRAPSFGDRREMLTRIQSAAPDAMQGLQNTIFHSREEATALLARLRGLAMTSGS